MARRKKLENTSLEEQLEYVEDVYKRQVHKNYN